MKEVDQPVLTSNPDQLPAKVLVGISGGVDSGVAALLLQKKEAQVIGLTMITDDLGWQQAEDAAAICKTLDMEHRVVDLRQEFADSIVKDFVQAYTEDRTPNPCISCNPQIKFALLYDYASKLGCGAVASGHYAQVYRLPKQRLALAQASNGHKDQSYFLSRLSQEHLAKLVFPLASMDKQEVRQLAQDNGLLIADGSQLSRKADSQDNCFIAGSYADFVRDYLAAKQPQLLYMTQPGDILSEKGQVIGQHKGVINYTIGQRKGFEVKTTERLFVIDKNSQLNTITVGRHELLRRRRIRLSQPVFSGLAGPDYDLILGGKIRHSAQLASCRLIETDQGLEVLFDQDVLAPVRGQTCALYSQGLVMASGFIEDSFLD